MSWSATLSRSTTRLGLTGLDHGSGRPSSPVTGRYHATGGTGWLCTRGAGWLSTRGTGWLSTRSTGRLCPGLSVCLSVCGAW